MKMGDRRHFHFWDQALESSTETPANVVAEDPEWAVVLFIPTNSGPLDWSPPQGESIAPAHSVLSLFRVPVVPYDARSYALGDGEKSSGHGWISFLLMTGGCLQDKWYRKMVPDTN
jgi:hypothetical protein